MEKKNCIRCKAQFEPKRRTARYCGDKCASAERSRRYRARHFDPKPMIAAKIECPICKKEVLVLVRSGGPDRKYCSETCRKTAEKLVKKDN